MIPLAFKQYSSDILENGLAPGRHGGPGREGRHEAALPQSKTSTRGASWLPSLSLPSLHGAPAALGATPLSRGSQ